MKAVWRPLDTVVTQRLSQDVILCGANEERNEAVISKLGQAFNNQCKWVMSWRDITSPFFSKGT
jgi:hypothetical protein